MRQGDLYQTLGVGRDADPATIRRAYRRKAKTEHPDTGGSAEGFRALTLAHDVLTDQERRAKYDATGDVSGEAADNRHAELMLNACFDSVFREADERGMSFENIDFVARASAILKGRRAAVAHDIETLDKAIAKVEKIVKRFRAKPGKPNRLGPMMQGRVEHMQRSRKHNMQTLDKIEAALAILCDHSFDVAGAEPFGAPRMQSIFLSGTTGP